MSVKILLFFLISISALAQDSPTPQSAQLEIGKLVPDFSLNTITHYDKTSASSDYFRGKWLVLDFWFTSCINCIKSLPKINSLQQQFKDEVLFLLVGKNDSKFNKGISELYERLCEKQDLQLAASYDSVLWSQWSIHSAPHIIIIDPNGIVKAITDGRDMSKTKIRDLIDGKEVSFYSKEERPEFNAVSFSTRENNVLYRSLLTKWNGESQLMRNGIKDEIKYLKESEMKLSMVPLEWLYNWAYLGYTLWDHKSDSLYGKVYPYPVLEMKDSSLFQCDFNVDLGRGTYNYNLLVPPSRVSVGYIMNVMQQDLKNVFGYEVSIETRLMPVWKLIAYPGAKEKLKTKGGKMYVSGEDSSRGVAGFSMKNCTMDLFLDRIMTYIGVKQPPFFDETGINSNIDITIDALMTDVEDVKKALRKNNLDLVKGSKEMKVMVIRDTDNIAITN